MYFADTLTGYVIGRERYEDDDEHVWKTTNGGISRQKIFTSNIGFWDVHEIQFPSRDIGYIADGIEGHGGGVYKTTDGGATWEKILTKWVHSMYFVANDTGYVTSYGKIYKTTNGRDFFRLKGGMGGCEIYPIHFIKGTQTGYVNCMSFTEGRKILKTVDGGGESLGFWQPLTIMPDKPNKGALLTAYPYSNSLFLQEIGKERRLWSYNIINDSWYAKRPFPEKLKGGASITSNEDGLFVLSGNSNQCWNYNPEGDNWQKLPDISGVNVVKKGGCITTDAEGNLYVLKGGKTNEFYCYNQENNQWQQKPDIPGTFVTKGASIACDNEYVYAIKGGKTNEFWSYDIAGDSWHRLLDIYGKGFKDGSCLSANPYAETESGVMTLKGGGQECWYYGSYWKLIPGIPIKKKIGKGAQLTVDENNIFYAIKNNRQTQIWQTDEFIATSGYKPAKLINHTQTKERISKSRAENKIYLTNPAKSVLTVRIPLTLNLIQGDRKPLRIFDVTGKLIREIASASPRNDGLREIKISLQGINPGIYFLQLGKETKKFLVVE